MKDYQTTFVFKHVYYYYEPARGSPANRNAILERERDMRADDMITHTINIYTRGLLFYSRLHSLKLSTSKAVSRSVIILDCPISAQGEYPTRAIPPEVHLRSPQKTRTHHHY